MIRRIPGHLLGYDAFVSYAYSDGRQYAKELERQLANLDVACFFDEQELPYGEELTRSLGRAIRHSKVFVLVATSGSLDAPYVNLELECALSHRRPVIPIDVDEIRTRRRWPALQDVPWVNDFNCKAGGPSAAALENIRRHFRFTRRNVIARCILVSAALAFLAVALLATWQWRQAVAQTNYAIARQLAVEAQMMAMENPALLESRARLAAESMRRVWMPANDAVISTSFRYCVRKRHGT